MISQFNVVHACLPLGGWRGRPALVRCFLAPCWASFSLSCPHGYPGSRMQRGWNKYVYFGLKCYFNNCFHFGLVLGLETLPAILLALSRAGLRKTQGFCLHDLWGFCKDIWHIFERLRLQSKHCTHSATSTCASRREDIGQRGGCTPHCKITLA